MRRSLVLVVCLVLSLPLLPPGASPVAAADGDAESVRVRPFRPVRVDHAGEMIDVLPYPEKDPGPATPRGERITKDLRTGQILRRPGIERPDAPPTDRSVELPRRIGALYDSDLGLEEESFKNFGSWNLVSDPTAGIYPMHVKLFMSGTDIFGMTFSTQCSGTLIDPMHVLTAGHCIYVHDRQNGTPVNDWVDAVQVIPGYMNSNRPWGTAGAAQLHSWTGWTSSEEREHDVGVIDLDRPVGALVGWRSYGYSTDCSWWQSSGWRHAGYPAESPFDGELMYTNVGDFDACLTPIFNLADFDMPSWGGASGSGAVKNGTAWGVLTASDRESFTRDTTLDSGKFGDIGAFLFADRIGAADLWALYALTGQSQQNVAAGGSLGAVSFRVHNYASTAWSGQIPYEVVVSADSIITGADRVIYSNTLSLRDGIDALTTYGALIPSVSLPADLSPGKWFIGVRLLHSDADNGNNSTGEDDVDWVTVTCPAPPIPWVGTPADGAECVPRDDATLIWGDLGAGYTYEVRVSSSSFCSGGDVYTVATNSLDLPPLSIGDWSWQVRAVAACGTVGAWSQCMQFTTDFLRPPPTVVHPPDGDLCQPAYQVTIDWDPVPDAQAYQVRMATECGLPVTPVTKTLTAHTYLNLNENVTYYYQVRSQSTCGNWGSWSACRSFTTKPSVMATPDLFFPPEGYACVGSGGGISWNAIEAASGYEVMLSQDGCASGTIYPTTTNVMTLPDLPEGDWQWKVRSVHACGDLSAWSDCHSFTVDATPPSAPTWIQSKSHVPAKWSSLNELEMAWEVAVDEDCGLVFYQLLWSESDQPPPLPWFTGVPDAEYTTPPLADGADWWFHVWAQDGGGNFVASPISAGPFRIDTTPPDNPVVEASPAAGAWSNATSLSAAWTGAQDAGAGLAGYRWLLDQVPGTDPVAAPVSPDSSDTFAPLAEGEHWLHLAVMDGVENWSAPLHVGPFLIDLTPPTASLIEPSSGTPLRHADPVTIRWNEGDALSGVAWIALWWSPDSYATLYPIAEGPPSQMGHAYNWTVPFVEGDELRLRLAVTDAAGNVTVVDEARPHTVTRAVGVDGPVAGLPERLVLGRNVPNPFNPQTEIRYGLPAEGTVRLVIYDASGRAVRTLVDGIQDGPGWHRVVWDGRADNGRRAASGTYFYRLEAAGEVRSRRMALVK